jgi:hypothetical protein
MARVNMLGRWKGLRKESTNDNKGEAYLQANGTDLDYRKAAAWLDDGPVEDWGCGTCYAKQFFTQPYVGVDGTDDYADVVADLRDYTSNTHGILLRGVLEHNWEWKEILKNALASCQKLVVITFTPFVEKTRHYVIGSPYWQGDIPTLAFKKTDLTEMFPSYTEEAMSDEITIFYVTVKP